MQAVGKFLMLSPLGRQHGAGSWRIGEALNAHLVLVFRLVGTNHHVAIPRFTLYSLRLRERACNFIGDTPYLRSHNVLDSALVLK